MIYIINDIYSVLSNKNLFYIRYYFTLYSFFFFIYYSIIIRIIFFTRFISYSTRPIIIDQNNIDFCKKSRHQFIIESILVRLTYFQM